MAAAHLPAPEGYDTFVRDAAALTGCGRYGMAAATDPAEVFTQQSFEGLPLADGCRLVNDHGSVTLDSPACRTAFATYDTPTRRHGPPGTQTADPTGAAHPTERAGWAACAPSPHRSLTCR